MKELINIYTELKAPKNQFNKFGKYNYRSLEDILEAVKPLLKKYECTLQITDEVKEIGGMVYVEATAIIMNKEGQAFNAQAQAGIEKGAGMSLAQSFGASSSYARKYALSALLLIDDVKDSDATNTHGKDPEPEKKEGAWVTPILEEQIEKVESIEGLMAIYNAHSEVCKSNPAIMRKLSAKRKTIENGKN